MTQYDYNSWNLHDSTVERLEQHREHKRETQDDVVNNVLDKAEGAYDSDVDTEALATEIKDKVVAATEPGAGVSAQEVIERINDLEAAVKEATNAAQAAQREVEGMGPQQ